MKTLLPFLLLAAAVSVCDAQWLWQNPWPTGSTLSDVCFVDASHGWAVGDQNTILCTTDGGRNWSQQRLNSSYDLLYHRLQFVDRNHGWVWAGGIDMGGTYEYLFGTTDGGTRWNFLGEIPAAMDLFFVSSSEGWAVNWYTGIFQTTDAGRTWVVRDTTLSARSVFFRDPQYGWVVGGNGVLSRTTDGGNSWTGVTVGYGFAEVYFVDRNNGWIAGWSLFRTTDGGLSWSPQQIPGATSFGSIQFIDQNKGWVVVSIGGGSGLFCTTDGGLTWRQQFPPRLGGMSFADANDGWIIADDSVPKIFHTSTGGDQWEEQSRTITTRNLNWVQFTDANYGWIVGDSSTVIRSTNGGDAWSFVSGLPTGILSGSFVNNNVGWLVGANGIILHTSNGGNQWNSQTPSGATTLRFTSAHFEDALYGWVVGSNAIRSEGRMLRTTDGGARWTSLESWVGVKYNGVSFIDRNTGWVVGEYVSNGDGVLIHTTNGGTTWLQQGGLVPPFKHPAIYFADADYGWMWEQGPVTSEPRGAATTDGGATWRPMIQIRTAYSGPFYFSDHTNGWGVYWPFSFYGNHPKAIVQFPAGEPPVDPFWLPESVIINSVSFPDRNNGWYVGTKGTILHTTNGGVTFVEQPRSVEVPSQIILEQNYPNPFNPSTSFEFKVPSSKLVTLKVYDVLGREVATLVSEVKQPGTYTVQWDASSQASGVYFYRLHTGAFVATRKLCVIR